MFKIKFLIIPLLFFGTVSFSQVTIQDSVSKKSMELELLADTTLDFELMMKDLDWFLDSISTPHSYFMGTVGFGKGYYNFSNKADILLETESKLAYTPMVGYFHKSGFNFSAIGNMLRYNNKTSMYQFSISPGYDYLENRDFAAGLIFTRYFTRNDIPFYTTPLQNEIFSYFTYRKWWMKPSMKISYGWGSRSEYSQRATLIQDLRLRRDGIIKINSKESVNDFSISWDVKHDFYWLDIFSNNDHIRISPQMAFDCGTQKFGFNQSANTYATTRRRNSDILYQTENIYLDDQLQFQPLSLVFLLRGEYSIGKFFIQSQLTMDYYFPALNNNFSTIFSLNTGFVF